MATLALRLLYLHRSVDAAWPHTMLYEGDATVWAQWAALLHAGQPFESDLAFRTPGVAWLLHWMGAVAPPFTMAKVVWCGMSAATPAALYLVMARWFTRTAGVLAALLCALGFGSFVMAVSLNNEAPYALLLVCITGVTLAWVDRPTWKLGVMLGVLHGAAMLLRAEHLLLMEMLCALAAWQAWRGRVAPGRIATQTLWGAACGSCRLRAMVAARARRGRAVQHAGPGAAVRVGATAVDARGAGIHGWLAGVRARRQLRVPECTEPTGWPEGGG